MDANPSHYVICHHGVFVLPDELTKALAAQIRNGFVYLREDDEVLTISIAPIDGGYRRLLSGRFRAPMFRGAATLGIVDYRESLRVMAVS